LSIGYYDRNSAAFFARTAHADLGAAQTRFLTHVPKGGSILEAGCGSGRDALAFARAGYSVTAFDGSAKMAELARAHTGLAVLHKRFEEVDWADAFDGIWSCACLLHVPRSELRGAMARLARALKPGGAWFMSFKYGDSERLGRERHFTDMNEMLLAAAIADVDLSVADLWISDDDRSERRGEKWTNAIAHKR
jgi:SAM-dependent methyltransferase